MSEASDLVTAVWCGPFACEFPDGTVLNPGDSHEVPAASLSSGHWRKATAPKAPKADS